MCSLCQTFLSDVPSSSVRRSCQTFLHLRKQDMNSLDSKGFMIQYNISCQQHFFRTPYPGMLMLNSERHCICRGISKRNLKPKPKCNPKLRRHRRKGTSIAILITHSRVTIYAYACDLLNTLGEHTAELGTVFVAHVEARKQRWRSRSGWL
jgi:hypothetical protein